MGWEGLGAGARRLGPGGAEELGLGVGEEQAGSGVEQRSLERAEELGRFGQLGAKPSEHGGSNGNVGIAS